MRICNLILVSTLWGGLPSVSIAYDKDYYSECILKYVKSGMDRSAVHAVRSACFEKATPKKCRELQSFNRSPHGDPAVDSKEACTDECKNAGLLSRKFGSCAPG